jgi:3-methylcrotonyl-CoA carboxylase alpha subunit
LRRKLGLAVAGVHSTADAGARHVREIGESLRDGGTARPAESYLNIDTVVAAALRCGADAVHPGYGFVSENAAFARAAGGRRAGLRRPPARHAWSGWAARPSPSAEARRLGIPVVPGSEGALDDAAAVAALVRTHDACPCC